MNIDFSDIRVLLIGDLMIDHYIMGTSNRMSPEAPVPVVLPEEEYSIPGGAANVAMNLNAMGAEVTCLGAVGDDIWGEKLLSILKDKGINTGGIKIIKNHYTTLKQRIYSDGKQVARIDKENIVDIKSSFLPKNIDDYNVCILSDYNKGIIKDCNINANKMIVDPKKEDFNIYKNANIITPNLKELQRATDITIKDDLSIVDACTELIKKYNFNYIVTKKGEKGMTIVGKNGFIKHIEAYSVKNPDVTGAGDTVIAALSISYAKTNDIEFSANIANAAAAAAVRKRGTATDTIEEINSYISINE